MIIKKFIANTEAEAIRMMKEEMGPKAVVVSRKAIRPKGLKSLFAASKVEITAAADGGGGQSKRQSSPESMSQEALNESLTSLKNFVSEVEEASEDRVTLSSAAKQQLKKRQPALAQTYAETRKPVEKQEDPQEQLSDLLRASRDLVSQFGGKQEKVEAEPESPPVELSPPTEADKLCELRRMVQEEVNRAQKSVGVGGLNGGDEETVGSVRFLMAKGVSRQIASQIEERLEQKFGPMDLSRPHPQRTARMNAMKRELAALVETAGPIRLKKGQCTMVALVGPHGVGKTTTLTKLAVEYSRRLGKRVAIISLDQAKVGAREQIQGLSDQFRIPLSVATNSFEFQQALQEYQDRDLTLIDTSGRSQYDRQKMDELAECLSLVDHLQTYLTVSASTKDIDIYGAIQQYVNLSVDGLIVTKLDETIAYGTMVNLCQATGMPIAYLCVGPRIPDDLKVADSDDIARTLMLHHNNQEYQSLRQLVAQ